jgi:hypothetical protein
MDDMSAFEAQVAREALREAGSSQPVDVVGIVRTVTTTRALRRWSVFAPRLGRRITPGQTEGGFSMFSAVKVVVAGAVVALFGGFLLGGALTTQPAGETAPGAAALDTSEPWDLVWFSDSTGFFVADLWAERIEGELGVEVRVHDHAVGALAAGPILYSLGEPVKGYTRLGDTRDEIAEAEIIVVYGNPDGSGMTSDFGDVCVSTSAAPRDPPTRYAEEDFAPYRDILDSIWERVFELTGDRPVVMRAMDSYMPVIADWRAAGIEPECTAAWEAYSDTIRDAAAAHGVPMVSMYDAFNGPDHTEDPRLKGYIGSDGEHTLPAGRDAMVEALHAAGYEPVQR